MDRKIGIALSSVGFITKFATSPTNIEEILAVAPLNSVFDFWGHGVAYCLNPVYSEFGGSYKVLPSSFASRADGYGYAFIGQFGKIMPG